MSEPTKGPEFIHVERLLDAPVIDLMFQLPDSADPCCR